MGIGPIFSNRTFDTGLGVYALGSIALQESYTYQGSDSRVMQAIPAEPSCFYWVTVPARTPVYIELSLTHKRLDTCRYIAGQKEHT